MAKKKRQQRKKKREERKDNRQRKRGYRKLFLFKPLMRKRLKAKGIPLKKDKDVVELAEKFFTHVVKGKPYDKAKDVFAQGTGDRKEYRHGYGLNFETENLVDDMASAAKDVAKSANSVIQAIIDFFKNIRKKRQDKKGGKKGIKESAEESDIADELEKVEDKLDENGEPKGETNWLYIILIFVAAYFFFKK